MNTEPTQCKYEATAHGRCFRPTMRPDGLCFYHNPEAMAKRKPKRLSRKALQAERDRLLLQLGEAYEVLALTCRGSKGERDCYICAAPKDVHHYDDSPCKILNHQRVYLADVIDTSKMKITYGGSESTITPSGARP